MCRRVFFIAAVVLFALNASAAIDLSSPSTAMTGLGPCGRKVLRCVAAAGGLLVWVEDADGRTRLRAAIGSTRIDLAEAASIDHPALATDGQSFLVAWQQETGRGLSIAAAQLSANGRITDTWTFPKDRATADVPVNVAWTGLEYALALPESLVFLREGAVPRTVWLGAGTASLLAAGGDSVVVVRRMLRALPPRPYPYDKGPRQMVPVFVTNLVGSGLGPTHDVVSTAGAAASLAAGGDGYLLVWKDDQFVRALRLDQAGAPVNAGDLIARHRSRGGSSAVTATRDGWLLLWDDGGPLFAAEVNANGRLSGEVFTVATGARSPAIVKLGEDRFRVFWRGATSIESRIITTGGATIAPPRRRVVR